MRRLLLASILAGCDARPTDVVFITVDTLRYDHISAMNPSSPARTPNIDRLAREGVVFRQAYSPISVTGPAFCSLMTGQEPGTHGVVLNIFRGGVRLDPETPTLAKQLHEAGYSTGAFLSGFTLRDKLGLRDGFDVYDAPKSGRRAGNMTVDMLWGWMFRQPSNVFVWYHSYDPHGPLDVYSTPAVTKSTKRGGPDLDRIPLYQRIDDISDPAFFAGRYVSGVEFADAQVGRIYNVLHNTGRWDDALIVITADHGESFDERELWFDHGTTAYEEQLHVPLIIRYPRGERGGTTVDSLVSLIDVMPTVLDYLGMPVPDGVEGVSLWGDEATTRTQLTGESSHCKGEAVLTCAPKGPDGKMFAVRDAGRTTIRHSSADGVHFERYDRQTDAAERFPLPVSPDAGDESQEDAQAVRVLSEMATVRDNMNLASPDAPSAEPTNAAEEAEREQLRKLGYIE